jgi:hypothetical protein
MYYKGTKEDCEAYNTIVVEGEEYDGVFTSRWARVIAHPNGKDFAIKSHDNYESIMSSLSNLGSAWFPEEE